jgi:hypothetical protein
LGVVDVAPFARAALLTRCELVIDGSSQPPGDRIECELVCTGKEKTAVVEVRAFRVFAKSNEPPAPVAGAQAEFRDDKGRFLLTANLSPRAGSRSATQSLTIPYAALDLPSGEHQLGYEVLLLVDGEAAEVQPLPLSIVRVGATKTREVRPQPLRQAEPAGTSVDEVVSAAIGGDKDEGAPHRSDVRLHSSPRVQLDRASTRIVQRGFDRAPATPQFVPRGRLADLSGQPWQQAADVLPPQLRVVKFATNRSLDSRAADSAAPKFLAAIGPLVYGECQVNFPVRNHRRGRLERPSWWQSLDPEKHFLVESTKVLDEGDFFAGLGQDDLLLFVHGFANGFDDAVMCTAQLAADVDFPGRPMAFCWPSVGEVSEAAYGQDAAQAGKSIAALADLLDRLTAPTGDSSADGAGGRPPRLHVLAHSMGNRIVLEAVYQLVDSGRWPQGEKRLGQVVLAAPDVGAAQFNQLVDYTLDASDRVTYYYYANDLALNVSREFNKYEPVGMIPYFERGLDTINAEGSGTDFLGHSYYSSSVKMLADFELLLKYGYGPERRIPPLGAKTRVFGHDHWSFLPLVATEAGGN